MFSRTDMSGTMPVRLAVLAAIADAERDRLGGLLRRDRLGRSARSFRRPADRRRRSPARPRCGRSRAGRRGRRSRVRAPRRARPAPCVRSASPSADSTTSPAAACGRGKSGRMGAHRLEVAPEHRRDEVELVDIGHAAGHHRAPVAHHRDAVADLIELVEPMADEDDRHALRAQAAASRRTEPRPRARRARRSARP